jgi:hypothetical protein
MKRGALLAVVVLVAGCGAGGPSSSPSAAPTLVATIRETSSAAASPTEATLQSPALAPTAVLPSGTPRPGDADIATATASRFLQAFVGEQWATAFGLLAPASQLVWGGSVTAFRANWPNPARDTGGTYTLSSLGHDPEEALTLGETAGADLARGFLFNVAFPNPSHEVPGPYMMLLVAPYEGGVWLVWRLR